MFLTPKLYILLVTFLSHLLLLRATYAESLQIRLMILLNCCTEVGKSLKYWPRFSRILLLLCCSSRLLKIV